MAEAVSIPAVDADAEPGETGDGEDADVPGAGSGMDAGLDPSTEPGEPDAGAGNRAAAASARQVADPASDQVDLDAPGDPGDSLAASDDATQPVAGEPAETDKAARLRPDGV